MKRRIPSTGALSGLALLLLGMVLNPDSAIAQTATVPVPAQSPPPTTRPPTPPTPPPTTPTPRPPFENPRRTNEEVTRQLVLAQDKCTRRLEEASSCADELVKVTRELNAEIAKNGARKTYRELGAGLELVGADMQGMISRLRAVREDPVLKDEELMADTERMLAMENLLNAMIRVLHEAKRMSAPITILAKP